MSVLSTLGAEPFGFSNEIKKSPSAYDIWAQNYKLPDSELIGDIADFDTLKKFIAGVEPEIIFHLAAQPLVLQSYEDPLETVKTNILGTANLLESCRGLKSLQAVMIITTDKVYKIGDHPKSFTEEDGLGGKDLYSSSKACCELLTESYRHSFFNDNSLAICTVRAGNVIGGGDWSDNRLVPDLVRAQKAEETCIIRNSGAVRPWQHVLEPLSGYMLLAEKAAVDKKLAGAWNFGPGPDNIHTVKDLAERVVSFFGDLKINYEDNNKDAKLETDYLAIKSAKAQKHLGWAGRMSFDETVKNTCSWYQAQTDAERKNITEQQIANFWEI